MSLSRARLIYGCGVAIIAALLISAGSPVYIGSAAILIVAAPPLFRGIKRASAISAIRALDLPQEDAHHNQ